MSSSKTQSLGFLSDLRRLNLGNRNFPSAVIPEYNTSQTILGRIQVIGDGASIGSMINCVFVTRPSNFGFNSPSIRLSNPPPTFAMWTSFPPASYNAVTTDPKVEALAPSPLV